MEYINLFNKFKQEYYKKKGKPFYKAQSREFVYECIKENIYNTELVCTMKGVKNVSRFIADKEDHIKFLEKWCIDNNLFIYHRKLRKTEKEQTLNNKINYIVYICKNQKRKQIIENFEKGESKYSMGDVLNYPKCCSSSQEGVFTKPSNKELLKNFVNSGKIIDNPFFNFVSTSLSFFFPCKIDCKNANKKHLEYSQVILENNKKFHKNMINLFSMPMFISLPPNEVLTTELHYDEIFKVHFKGKIFNNKLLVYKDFLIVSYSFLEQETDKSFSKECLDILYALLEGDNILKEKEHFLIRKGSTIIMNLSSKNKKFLQFS